MCKNHSDASARHLRLPGVASAQHVLPAEPRPHSWTFPHTWITIFRFSRRWFRQVWASPWYAEPCHRRRANLEMKRAARWVSLASFCHGEVVWTGEGSPSASPCPRLWHWRNSFPIIVPGRITFGNQWVRGWHRSEEGLAVDMLSTFSQLESLVSIFLSPPPS